MEKTEIEIREYPQPDPSWDYFPVWEELIKIDQKLIEILQHLAVQEEATPEYDERLHANLMLLAGAVASAGHSLKKSKP